MTTRGASFSSSFSVGVQSPPLTLVGPSQM
jgi:hypothetical protein